MLWGVNIKWQNKFTFFYQNRTPKMLIIHEQLRQGGTFSTVQYDIYSVLASCCNTSSTLHKRRAVLSPRGLKWINRSSECNYLLISFLYFLPQCKVQVCIQPVCLFCAGKEFNMAFILKERNSLHQRFCWHCVVRFEIWEGCGELCIKENETFGAAKYGTRFNFNTIFFFQIHCY